MSEVYTGRFAPSPTGLLHPGSLVAALASWLDARTHGGQWLVRIEDVDTPRCLPGADLTILQQLTSCSLVPDGPVLWQSQRGDAYEAALQSLVNQGWAYPCGCSRKEIESAQAVARHSAAVYPGTCREGLQGKPARAWRLNVQAVQTALGLPAITHWHDRRLGPQQQNVCEEVGDFVLRRADGLWAYQLAVVVDDAAQGVTDVVRGVDLPVALEPEGADGHQAADRTLVDRRPPVGVGRVREQGVQHARQLSAMGLGPQAVGKSQISALRVWTDESGALLLPCAPPAVLAV